MTPQRQFANHPDPMDLWLETQGLYRKCTARDGSCLFRAMAEQVYNTQRFHLESRKQCVDYMRNHLELFQGHEVEGGTAEYLEHMLSPTQWGGKLEIIAMSHMYKIDIFIFKDVGVPAEKVTETSYGRKVMLCFSFDRHYDSVYPKEFTKIAGFCQSLVYELLYEKVFKMKDIYFAVDKMLHYKSPRQRGDLGLSGPRKFFSYSCNSIQLQKKGMVIDAFCDEGEVKVRDLIMKGVTPFPYKVAKSLDPCVFRNVEFDVWIDYRRGIRQGYIGSNNELCVGVKCLVKINNDCSVAHIQEMAPNKGPVVVFVEELGKKCTVPFENLELLPQEPISPKQVPSNQLSPRNLSKLPDNKASTVSSPNGSPSNKFRKSRPDSEGKGKNRTAEVFTSQIVYRDPNVTSFASLPSMEGFSSNGDYHHSYQQDLDQLSINMPVQGHVMMQSQQHCNSQILIPVSPRPEDVPAHWLTPNGVPSSTEMSIAPSEVSTSSVDLLHPREEPGDLLKEAPQENVLDNGLSVNYVDNTSFLEEQINFNAPKSVLDDGADLPMSDIQTLRFFYNLGNDVYRSQCSMYGWGGYSQPFTATSPSTPNPLGMCAGKCVCGPVCIATVPTIHHLLEPTTPPTNVMMQHHDSTGGTVSSSETESSQPTTSTPLSSVSPKFKAKGKNRKDSKAYEGQPLVQPTLQIPATNDSVFDDSQNSSLNIDHASPTLAVPFSPTYGYVYYPTSPVVPYSPVEADPYFTPLRLQFPTDYMPDTSQSPQCFPVNGNINIYSSQSQYPIMATSPHYLIPASPEMYVGSPPSWSPIPPTTPQ